MGLTYQDKLDQTAFRGSGTLPALRGAEEPQVYETIPMA